MLEQAILAMIENDDATVVPKAVDELFPFTDECISYWGLTNALYGGRFLTTRQISHVISCEHCTGRIDRMVERNAPAWAALKSLVRENAYSILAMIEKHGGIGSKLQIAALRLWTDEAQMFSSPLAKGASFAPVETPVFETSQTQMLDEVTEAMVELIDGELILHVDSSQPRTIRLGLVQMVTEEEGPAIANETILELKEISNQDWTGTHSFGPASILHTRWGEYIVLAEIHRDRS